MRKTCTKCGAEKSENQFPLNLAKNLHGNLHAHCNECRAKTMETYNLTSKYNTTPSQVAEMKKKVRGLCQICSEAKELEVDHCHKTLNIRGLLCHDCNIGLGMFGDSPKKLRSGADYLDNSSKVNNLKMFLLRLGRVP